MTSSELKKRIQKTVDFLESELTQIRTGRANPALLEDIKVTAYEATMTIKELGSITLADAHTILISPWDRSLLSVIAKAIAESEHKLNAMEQGANLRVPIPPLTEDRRKELAKLVNTKVEEAKQSIRNIRQEAMKDIDQGFEAKELTEDDKFLMKEETEEIVKENVQKVEEMGEVKASEIMTI